MATWKIVFYPPAGNRNSPVDALFDLCNQTEQALITEKLSVAREFEPWEWPNWIKLVSGIYQIRSGDFRIYFDLDDNSIVVTHICRKTTPKAKTKDIAIAKNNFARYKAE